VITDQGTSSPVISDCGVPPGSTNDTGGGDEDGADDDSGGDDGVTVTGAAAVDLVDGSGGVGSVPLLAQPATPAATARPRTARPTRMASRYVSRVFLSET
jgi:hypothetical protein